MHPLAGLTYVATICSASDGASGMLHVVARHAIDEQGGVHTEILSGPTGAQTAAVPAAQAELLAEQGDSLVFRTRTIDESGTTTVVLTLHSSGVGEVTATTGGEWVRATAAIERLPALAHEH